MLCGQDGVYPFLPFADELENSFGTSIIALRDQSLNILSGSGEGVHLANNTIFVRANLLPEEVLEDPAPVMEIVNQRTAGRTIAQRFSLLSSQTASRFFTREVQALWRGGKSVEEVSRALAETQRQTLTSARRIVRTESNRISNAISSNNFMDLKAAGVPVVIRWKTKIDGRERDTHNFLHNQVADSEGYFYSGSARTLAPSNWGVASEDVNCRCATIMDNPTDIGARPEVTAALDRAFSLTRVQSETVNALFDRENI